MWQNPRYNDDPFTTPPETTPPSAPFKWAARVARPARFSSIRLNRFKIGVLLLVLGTILLFRKLFPSIQESHIENTNLQLDYSPVPLPTPGFEQNRVSDTIDTFSSYKFRSTCNISSLDLHTPFSPLCPNRASTLEAMSGGGRIGMDAPYLPRGCDMRWFSTNEVCEILGRFDKVILVGDSMVRHLIGAINILVRKNLGYGAVTDWNFSGEERKECFCNEQFDAKACSVQGIYKTADVVLNDPGSFSCGNEINVIMEQIVRFPIPADELHRLALTLSGPHSKGIAIILGHGLWSNLDLTICLHWLDAVLSTITRVHSLQTKTNQNPWPALFVSPNAAGKEKPDEWIVSQGNKALMLYEEAMRIETIKRGLEFLGTWNMSVQKGSRDGVHMDMKGNLVKAMMVVNWLNLLP